MKHLKTDDITLQEALKAYNEAHKGMKEVDVRVEVNISDDDGYIDVDFHSEAETIQWLIAHTPKGPAEELINLISAEIPKYKTSMTQFAAAFEIIQDFFKDNKGRTI